MSSPQKAMMDEGFFVHCQFFLLSRKADLKQQQPTQHTFQVVPLILEAFKLQQEDEHL